MADDQLEKVFVRKCKRPVGSGVSGAYVLGRDADGLWLHTPAGSVFRGEDGHNVDFCEAGMGSDGLGRASVSLIPEAGWWIATWYGPHATFPIAVDICSPPTFHGSEWTYVDLELDPYVTRDGDVGTEDWDEFLDACKSGLIPPDEEAMARSATTQLDVWLKARTEPFGVKGFRMLETAQAMALPPLVDLDDVLIFPDRSPMSSTGTPSRSQHNEPTERATQ
ncbi:DUF402 domain-containing protein [Actinopolymorpha rutila]|uniref:DUF402 domain-containing protein n=1 Tax=Actinopolymorpha rutila TaxID=446787 RepID=A0A852ZTN7_9ACTN|nr:DUF402 domain-containing protein [Actinopolymorpha rutila]NYH92360.1 hypothetical protein [Actinopolymorpha rutila]